MRRTFAILLAVFLFGTPLVTHAALAAAPTVLVPSYYLADSKYPEDPLLSRSADTPIAPSSTTKLLTALLVLEQCEDLAELVTVPIDAEQVRMGSSLMGIKCGEVYTVSELLYGLLLVSGNDAAAALAVHCADSVQVFVDNMNARALELGMLHSNFLNPSGLYETEHLSTAHDMALLMAEIVQNEDFRKIVGTPAIDISATDKHPAFQLKNSNRLISDAEGSGYYYEFAIGGKTGTTPKGGNSLVTAAEKDGVTLVCVLMGLPFENTKGQRELFFETKQLYEYAFANLYATMLPEAVPVFECNIEVEEDNEFVVYRLYSGDFEALYLPRAIVENPQSLLPQAELFFDTNEAPLVDQAGILRYMSETTTYIEVPLYAEKLYAVAKEEESALAIAQSNAYIAPTPVSQAESQPLNMANILLCVGLLGFIPLLFWSRERMHH